jgi:hypothetical protein
VVRDVRSGWKWLSRNLAVSVNIRACSIGVYDRRSWGEDWGMNERVSIRQAYKYEHDQYLHYLLREVEKYEFRLINHRSKHEFRTPNTFIECPSV